MQAGLWSPSLVSPGLPLLHKQGQGWVIQWHSPATQGSDCLRLNCKHRHCLIPSQAGWMRQRCFFVLSAILCNGFVHYTKNIVSSHMLRWSQNKESILTTLFGFCIHQVQQTVTIRILIWPVLSEGKYLKTLLDVSFFGISSWSCMRGFHLKARYFRLRLRCGQGWAGHRSCRQLLDFHICRSIWRSFPNIHFKFLPQSFEWNPLCCCHCHSKGNIDSTSQDMNDWHTKYHVEHPPQFWTCFWWQNCQ